MDNTLIFALIVAVVASGWVALRRGRRATPVFVAAVVGLLVADGVWWTPDQPAYTATPLQEAATLAQVLALVRASNTLTSVPADIDVTPAAAAAGQASNGGGVTGTPCFAGYGSSTVGPCLFGDTRGPQTIVLYGDSHVEMWFQAVDAIARHDDWRLVILSKSGCPASSLVGRVAPLSLTHQADQTCRKWHLYAASRINELHPNLLVVSQDVRKRANGSEFTPAQWGRALTKTLRGLHAGRTVVLGNIPYSFGPECLLQKTVQQCSTKRTGLDAPYNAAERRAARSAGADYVDVTPWFCATLCSPVIGHFDVYSDNNHVAVGYTMYLEGVLRKALGI